MIYFIVNTKKKNKNGSKLKTRYQKSRNFQLNIFKIGNNNNSFQKTQNRALKISIMQSRRYGPP